MNRMRCVATVLMALAVACGTNEGRFDAGAGSGSGEDSSLCGNGTLDGSEQCDDGNRVDEDACRNNCQLAACGDGVVSSWSAQSTETAPAVTNPAGLIGRVCGVGSTCAGGTCDVSDVPGAPEHGICQALGYTRAVEVDWTGADGATDAVMPHAFNWQCANYACEPSEDLSTMDDCGPGAMLSSITCEQRYVEACDDGIDNADTEGACRLDCTLPRCGDGIIDVGEACDDGNTDDTDACRNLCIPATCGDGIVQDPEECDNAGNNNDIEPDSCRSNCLDAWCGDGVIDRGEACDDGAANSDVTSDACRRDCLAPRCGDGVVDAGEACDAGDANADADRAPCRTDCTEPTCGDGWLDDGEDCDDGNDVDTDECGNDCAARGCGDGVRSGGEECDDGNRNDDDACTNDCLLASCGDGVQQLGEECDDGNDDETDGCSSLCRLPYCGDGVISAGESCDDGNTIDTDFCSNSCTPPRCGDGVVAGDEACDDGNDDDTDGCNRLCRTDGCGDGEVGADEECDDGNLVNTDMCTNRCTIPVCGDGVVTRFRSDHEVSSPRVTARGGEEVYVCDDGSRCEGSTCNVEDVPDAREHGICQNLGYDRTVSVAFGGGLGSDEETRALVRHWACEDFVCFQTPSAVDVACGPEEMLRTVVCRDQVDEECDAGAANADEPDACRTDCSAPRCGDGIVDSGEECDDANREPGDGCSLLCRYPGCGDGVVQSGETCDDGNDVDEDTCTRECEPGPLWSTCADITVTGDGVYFGSTEGAGDDFPGRAGEDYAVAILAGAGATVTVETCGTLWDTYLSLYDGTLSCPGDLIAEDDDGCGSRASRLEFDVIAGSTYLVVVEPYAAAVAGEFELTIRGLVR